MKASWEKIEKNQGVLTVEVEAEQVASALDKAFKKIAAKINVPGFRKGKVPRGIFEAKFGVESLYQDALDILLPEAYMQAVKETGIEPVDRPEVDVQQIAKGQELKFSAKVVVKPEVTLGEYKGIEVPAASDEVTEEEVEAELKQMQQRHAELVVVEEGAAENGDLTVIDFEGFLDGVPFDGGKGENHSLELGSGSFIPGFEEQVVGMAKGEDKDLTVTFPEQYQAEELQGKEVVFKVHLHEIKRKNLPALDDEFALDVSEFETLEEYKQDIAKRLTERKAQANKREREGAAIDKAAEAATIDIPEAMIATEVESMLEEFGNRLKMQGIDMPTYFRITGQTEDQLKAQMSDDASKRVRNNLVLEAISKAEGIEATDEDVNAELEQMANTYQRTVEDVRNILTANGSLENMKHDLAIRKTVDFLLEHSTVAAAEA
ncbi:trigger factor [Paenibacillus cymbidii]|uniref:trigger factor n=1 Tax=Paenibacillus cymbidii TaxID=1639034 RepID=UPI0010806929|nr:trigger factor [Paenibacillus cymbidii]